MATAPVGRQNRSRFPVTASPGTDYNPATAVPSITNPTGAGIYNPTSSVHLFAAGRRNVAVRDAPRNLFLRLVRFFSFLRKKCLTKETAHERFACVHGEWKCTLRS